MCTGVGDGGGELDKFDIPRKQVVAPARAVFAVAFEEFVALEEGAIERAQGGFKLSVEARQYAIEEITPPGRRGGDEAQFARLKQHD